MPLFCLFSNLIIRRGNFNLIAFRFARSIFYLDVHEITYLYTAASVWITRALYQIVHYINMKNSYILCLVFL